MNRKKIFRQKCLPGVYQNIVVTPVLLPKENPPVLLPKENPHCEGPCRFKIRMYVPCSLILIYTVCKEA